MKSYRLLCTVFVFTAIWITTILIVLAQSNREITVFAASSLTDAFTDIAEAFESQYDVAVTLNFSGSTTLAAQLREGATADIFASANMMQMEIVIEQELVDDERVQIFAENQLVLIVPADNPANIENPEDLAESGTLLVMASESVPIRVYTDSLLARLSEIYGEDYLDLVMENVVSEEPNVRQVVARIVLGEADSAIVYRSDVTPDVADSLLVIDLPYNIDNPRAEYPIAPLIDSQNPETTELFIEFVLSEEGQEIMQKWGFCSPTDTTPTAEVTPEVTPEINDSYSAESESACG